jgi:protein-arginine kinase
VVILKVSKNYPNDDSPRIRESVAKGLSQINTDELIDFIDDWLNLEPLFRIKKWLMIALKKNSSKRTKCVLEKFVPEPELFLEHQKLLSTTDKPNNISLNISIQPIIHTVAGF